MIEKEYSNGISSKYFNFEEHFVQAEPSWKCLLCSTVLVTDNGNDLEQHFDECREKYIENRKTILEDLAQELHMENEIDNIGGWSKFIRDVIGDRAGKEYELLGLDKIPDNRELGNLENHSANNYRYWDDYHIYDDYNSKKALTYDEKMEIVKNEQ